MGVMWMRAIGATGLWLAIVFSNPGMIQAEDIRVMSVAVRAGVSWSSPIGEQTPQHFEQYDVAASLRLPWEWYGDSGWGVGTRLLVSTGAVKAAGTTASISTVVPGIAIGTQDGRIALELGFGGALLSDYRFGTQTLGGPFQVVWNMGLNVMLYRGIGMGYWFEHVSDAGIYGSDSRGFDMHMVELRYQF